MSPRTMASGRAEDSVNLSHQRANVHRSWDIWFGSWLSKKKARFRRIEQTLFWASEWSLSYVERRNAGLITRATFHGPNVSSRRPGKAYPSGHTDKQTNKQRNWLLYPAVHAHGVIMPTKTMQCMLSGTMPKNMIRFEPDHGERWVNGLV